nr:sigma-70 family RNA polymerase sigma factor [Fodinicola acaciae]
MSDNDEFVRLTDPFRRELLAHCYRMLGSVHDAEDLVQETYIRAWKAYDAFEGRSSLRTWLYKIATRTCLTALESRSKRPMPSDFGGPSDEPTGDLRESTEVAWLQPIPTAGGSEESPSDPAAIVTSKESTRLALIAALQHLPARQRAVLIMRDVLAWRAAEVAELLETSTAAVNSALQRARAELKDAAPAQDEVVEPEDPRERALLARYVDAFERYDTEAIMGLLKQDIVWEMPPFLAWFVGRENVRRLIEDQCPGNGPGAIKMVPTQANGQNALAVYIDTGDGVHRAHSLQVPTTDGDHVTKMMVFFDLTLFPTFGLPDVHPDDLPAAVPAGT